MMTTMMVVVVAVVTVSREGKRMCLGSRKLHSYFCFQFWYSLLSSRENSHGPVFFNLSSHSFEIVKEVPGLQYKLSQVFMTSSNQPILNGVEFVGVKSCA